MMKKKIYHITLLFVLALLLSFVNKPNRSVRSTPFKVSFGVKIGILPNGELTQYALMYYRDGVLSSIQGVPLNRLVKIGQGIWPVPNSSHFYNYFEENGLYNDTLEDGTVLDYGAAFDSLWKIRFNEHPFERNLGKGWSQGDIRPSLKQQAYIYNRYGVRGYDQDYFADTSFFQLLKDVMDESWIDEYKSMK